MMGKKDSQMQMVFIDMEAMIPQDHLLRQIQEDMLTKNFHKLWSKAFPEKKGTRTRPYDFRHHFVYANMNRWLREGLDVNAMLPYLMKYMGHSDVKNTQYYFHLVPDVYGAIVKKSLCCESLIPEVSP